MFWQVAWNHLPHDSHSTPWSSQPTVLSHTPHGATEDELLVLTGMESSADAVLTVLGLGVGLVGVVLLVGIDVMMGIQAIIVKRMKEGI